MSVFFTSDNHFGHRNVVPYCGRPFLTLDGQPDLDLMHQTMIRNWSDRVRPEDTVYHLGDFGFGSMVSLRAIRDQLPGRIVLILGNHDRSPQQCRQLGFDEVHYNQLIELDGMKLWLNHIPVGTGEEDRRQYRAVFKAGPPAQYDYFLCGHVHQHWARRGNVINVGVDVRGFRPVALEELLADHPL